MFTYRIQANTGRNKYNYSERTLYIVCDILQIRTWNIFLECFSKYLLQPHSLCNLDGVGHIEQGVQLLLWSWTLRACSLSCPNAFGIHIKLLSKWFAMGELNGYRYVDSDAQTRKQSNDFHLGWFLCGYNIWIQIRTYRKTALFDHRSFDLIHTCM